MKRVLAKWQLSGFLHCCLSLSLLCSQRLGKALETCLWSLLSLVHDIHLEKKERLAVNLWYTKSH